MKTFQVSPKGIFIIRLRIIIALTILFFVFGVVFVFVRWIALALAAAALLISGFLGFFYYPRALRNTTIVVDQERVIVRRGVFTHDILILPAKRLLYTETFASPLSKKLALRSLHINAARGKIIVPFLAAEDAEKIIALMSEERQ